VPLRPADLLPVDEADLVGPKFLLRPKLSRELVIGKARDALLFHLGEESQNFVQIDILLSLCLVENRTLLKS